MASLATTVNGLKLPNPFIVAAGPPSANANMIAKAFDEGWGAVVCKTVTLEASKIVSVTPRYARLQGRQSQEIYGWENIELISDRDIRVWLEEFRQLKDRYPQRVLIGSITEEYNQDRWIEIVERCQEAGVDALELNFSCPHGLTERNMGSALGQEPAIVEEVCGWVNGVAKVPVWAKMTPNVTEILAPGRAALRGGCAGLSAINTVLCVMGVNLDTLRPEPAVGGYSTPGGYSGAAIRPIALRMVMELARMMRGEFAGRTLSGIGGIESGDDAAQFLLLGADTVQVCTGIMRHGYGLVRMMCDELCGFMSRHHFNTIDDFKGYSLQFFTTYADLVRRQATARSEPCRDTVTRDDQWQGDEITEQSERLARD